jgi:hypothetical protein
MHGAREIVMIPIDEPVLKDSRKSISLLEVWCMDPGTWMRAKCPQSNACILLSKIL